MKRLVLAMLLVCGFAGGLYAQTVDTTVCAVLKNPTAFNGKMVRIQGTVVAGFDQFTVNDGNCGLAVNGIWITYPEGTKAKGGPLAMVRLEPAHNFAGTIAAEKRTPVVLDRDKEFKHFDSLLAEEHDPGAGVCLGCRKYDVQATLVGRLDAVASAALNRNGQGKIVGLGGFGNMNAYPARLVLESVSGVIGKKEDYSKSDAVTKQAPSLPAGRSMPTLYLFDPAAALQKDAARLQPGKLTTLIQKDAAVFPKGKEKSADGVSISYGAIDDVTADADTPGAEDSSDGVLYVCTLNKNQLGNQIGTALVHLGQHINDLRNLPPGDVNAPAYTLENNGWAVSTSFAIAYGTRYFTLPGGYLMWNAKWPQADRQADMQNALKDFLSKEELLSK